MTDDLLTKPFKPCAISYDDPKRVEIVLADTPIVWRDHPHKNWPVELGYDFEGKLVGVRIYNADMHTVF